MCIARDFQDLTGKFPIHPVFPTFQSLFVIPSCPGPHLEHIPGRTDRAFLFTILLDMWPIPIDVLPPVSLSFGVS